jgi:NAD(P)-dependent dehydrogenase (short-subunit alcohol dehydrogenase family)
MENTIAKRAAVIGASSGIGRATTELLAGQGYSVLAVGRDAAKLRDLSESLAAGGSEVTVRQADAASSAIARVLEEFAPISHLVLTLSSSHGGGPLATLDLAELRAGFDGKFWPHVATLRAALPFLSRGGSVTFVTACSAGASLPGTAGLAAINGALEAMVPVLAVELAPTRVNAVSPGVIDTAWWATFPEDVRAQAFRDYAQAAPAGRIGQAAEVAEAIRFVLESAFVTGSVLSIDGGLRLA